MSSRAIRKLQKLHEQQQQQSLDDSSDDDAPRPAKPKFNAFDLLNAGNDDDDNNDDDDGDNEKKTEDPQELEEENDKEPVALESEPEPEPAKPQRAKKKKKKSKNKSKQPQETSTESEKKQKEQQEDAEMDEIDRALKDLGVKGGPSTRVAVPNQSNKSKNEILSKFPEALDDLLSIQPKFLNPKTEMRKLFGDVALENFDQDAGAGRRRNQEENLDLGRALGGRYCPASRGHCLSAATLRQNPLFQGKGEWPLAPSGGLSMELNASLPSGRTLYMILHNTTYEDVQRQFTMCVESMDPQRMIFHLQHNPYHASTLLQVSEIAKHQGDHAVAADLLERVLFNIGRSAHSTFGAQLKKGKARLDFSIRENRDLWLTGWKYIADLGMKGTWRTAYEWGKLLLSLDESDPYCISLLIDSLALRGREYAHFVELCTQDNTYMERGWRNLLNIQCSLVLAYVRLKKPQESRQQLHHAMSVFPWVFNRLAQELDLQHIPKRIWGTMPPDAGQTLLTELYIARVKDLWNTPEAVALIVEVGDTLTDEEKPLGPRHSASNITLDIARHVIMSDYPSIISHIPQTFMARPLSASDPLPPANRWPFPLDRWPTQVNEIILNSDPEEPVPADDSPIHMQRTIRQLQFYEEAPLSNSDIEEAAHQWSTVNFHRDWLMGEGLDNLATWVSRYGVDRGNWVGCVSDYFPLFSYLEALALSGVPQAVSGFVRPPFELMYGPIEDAIGDAAAEMLVSELELWMTPFDSELPY